MSHICPSWISPVMPDFSWESASSGTTKTHHPHSYHFCRENGRFFHETRHILSPFQSHFWNFFYIFSRFSYTLTWRFRMFLVLFPVEKKAEEWKCWNSYWNNHCLACLLFSAERGIWSGKSKLCKNRRLPNWQIIVDPASRAGKHGKNSRGTRMSFASLGALIIFGYHGFGFLLAIPSVPTIFLKCSCWANFWSSSCPFEPRS